MISLNFLAYSLACVADLISGSVTISISGTLERLKSIKETFFGIPLDIWVKLDPVDRKLMAGVNCTQNPWEFDSEVVHEIITLGTSSIDPELLTPYILNKVEVARSQKSE